MIITIQTKSPDPRLPMNGKLYNIKFQSVGFSDGVLIVKYFDRDNQLTETQFLIKDISYFFIS